MWGRTHLYSRGALHEKRNSTSYITAPFGVGVEFLISKLVARQYAQFYLLRMNHVSLFRSLSVARPSFGPRLIGSSLCRRLATSSNVQKSAKLPLAGVKVLDMSRVLAGVR